MKPIDKDAFFKKRYRHYNKFIRLNMKPFIEKFMKGEVYLSHRDYFLDDCVERNVLIKKSGKYYYWKDVENETTKGE